MDISDSTPRIREILQSSRVIAVVGASDNPQRPSFEIAGYLLEAGYEMIPVNPSKSVILGKKCYPDLASIGRAVDIVDVFRNPAEVGPIVEDAIRIRARCVWMQTGISNPVAAARAVANGLWVVQDRCIATAHRLLFRKPDVS